MDAQRSTAAAAENQVQQLQKALHQAIDEKSRILAGLEQQVTVNAQLAARCEELAEFKRRMLQVLADLRKDLL